MLKKIASSTLSQVFAKIITASITIILLWLITNYFTVELFWVYNKIFNYIFIFAFLVDLGLYAITIKEISANKKNTEYIFWNILSLRLLSAIFVIIISVGIAYFLPWYNTDSILIWIFIASIFTFFSLINSNLLALMQAHMKIEFSIISVVLNKISVLAFTFYVIKYLYPNPEITWFNKPFYLIIWAVTIWMFINMIINYLYSKKITKIRLNFDFEYIKQIFFKSLPYWIALFLSVVYTKIDIIFLSLMEQWAIGDRSIALYSLPLKIMDVFMIIGSFFMNSLLPSLSENYKNNKFDKINEIIKNAFKVMFSTWVIIIVLGIVFKNNIIEIISNKQYLEITEFNNYTSSDAFTVVLFMILFFYLWIIFSYLLIAIDKQKKLLKISIILTISNIIGNIILIPYYSFIWAWMITVITQIIFLLLVYKETKNIINFKIPYIFITYISLLWIIIYLLLSYITVRFSINLFLDLIYWAFFFLVYVWIIWKIEKKYSFLVK
jgi:O-antigen/teichoic acid export membrane protein